MKGRTVLRLLGEVVVLGLVLHLIYQVFYL